MRFYTAKPGVKGEQSDVIFLNKLNPNKLKLKHSDVPYSDDKTCRTFIQIRSALKCISEENNI
jgi:hypothetical protein